MDQQIRILTTPEYQGWGALRPDVLEWNERRTSWASFTSRHAPNSVNFPLVIGALNARSLHVLLGF